MCLEITVGWEQSSYSVAEEGVELRVCATITGLTELYPRVSFTTTLSGDNSGQNCRYCTCCMGIYDIAYDIALIFIHKYMYSLMLQ